MHIGVRVSLTSVRIHAAPPVAHGHTDRHTVAHARAHAGHMVLSVSVRLTRTLQSFRACVAGHTHTPARRAARTRTHRPQMGTHARARHTHTPTHAHTHTRGV